MQLGEKINILRKEHKLTMQELADKSNLTKGYISMLEKGKNPQSGKPIIPSLDTVQSISSAFNLDLESFLENVDSKVNLPKLKLNSTTIDKITEISTKLTEPRQTKVYHFAENQLEEQNNVIEFPEKYVVSGRSSAAGSALYVDDADVRHDVLPASMVPSGADELVEIKGHSMEPLINNGEKVYIRYQPTVENGEIAIVRIENEGVTCKRVYVDGDTVTLKSENEDFSDMFFSPSEITILGKVLIK